MHYWRLALIGVLTLLPPAFGVLVQAQEAGHETTATAIASPPTVESPAWQAELLPLTAAQQAGLEYWTEHTHRPGPA